MASLSEDKLADLLLHKPHLIPVLRRIQRDYAMKNGCEEDSKAEAESEDSLSVLSDSNISDSDEVAKPVEGVKGLVMSKRKKLLLQGISKSGSGIKSNETELKNLLLSQAQEPGGSKEEPDDSQLLLKMVGEDSVADTTMDLSSTDNALHEHFQAESIEEEEDLPSLQPLTYTQRETRRIARQVQLEKMRISEQADERHRRYLKRQMGLVRDSDFPIKPKKPKKSVKWKDDQELLSFHVYSPPPLSAGEEQVIALLQS